MADNGAGAAAEEKKQADAQKKAEAAASKEAKKRADAQKKTEAAAAKEAARMARLSHLESERFSSWVPDDKSPCCRLCSKKFTLTSWHHHCRYCGNVICGDCSRDGGAATLVPEIQRFEAFNPEKKKKSAIRMCSKCDAGVSGLIAALRGGYTEAAQRFLEESLDSKVYPSAQDETSSTWLHHAAASGNATTVVWAIKMCRCAAAATVQDKFGKTPLVVAAEGGHLNIMVYLAQHTSAHVSELARTSTGPVLEHALFQSLLKQWTGSEPARHKFDAGGLATNTPADGSETLSSASAASGPSGPQHSLEDLVQSVSARRVSLQPAGDGTSQE